MNETLYFSFSPERADKRWPEIKEDIPAIVEHARFLREFKKSSNTQNVTSTDLNTSVIHGNEPSPTCPELTQRQSELLNMRDIPGLNYFPYAEKFDEKYLIQDLIELDIFFGSVIWNGFEEQRILPFVMESLLDVFRIEHTNYTLTNDGWLKLFSTISAEGLRESVKKFEQITDWRGEKPEETQLLFTDYLQALRPLVVDIKENPDAILFEWYMGGFPEPHDGYEILKNRAQHHAREFEGIASPLL